MRKTWKRIVSVIMALAMVVLCLPGYSNPVKTAKAAQGDPAISYIDASGEEKTLEGIKGGKTAPSAVFKKLITRYFQLFENEPLFQIYVFVRSEQYFNLKALKIVEGENNQICDSIKDLLSAFAAAKKIAKKTDKELKDAASNLAALIIQQRDAYIAARKETVRQNPDSKAGGLFALSTDEAALGRTLKLVEAMLKSL